MPSIMHISASSLMPLQVNHEYIPTENNMKIPIVQYVIKKEIDKNRKNVSDESSIFQALVFIDDTENTDKVFKSVSKMLENYQDKEIKNPRVGNVALLLDDMNIDDRADSLSAFRDGVVSVLICSDMASRGLDIPGVSMVVQMALPKETDTYVHRSGRTGRLGRNGTVITLTDSENEDFVIKKLENELQISIRKRKLKTK